MDQRERDNASSVKLTVVETLNTKKAEDTRKCIEVLKSAIREAEAGNMSAVAIVWAGPNGDHGQLISVLGKEATAMIGSLTLAQHKLAMDMWHGDLGPIESQLIVDSEPDPPKAS